MKLIKSLVSLFCATLTVVANEEQTAEEFLDQYLEENSGVLSEELLQYYKYYRKFLDQQDIDILKKLVQIMESTPTSVKMYSGDWMWFGAFPWVYSSKYESWLYLYSNLDVSIYGENGYSRKDSNYSTKMKRVWVVREEDSFLSYWNDPQQSRFAYSNDEKAWLHFKQSKGDELLSYSVDAQRWGVFGKEIFEWINIYISLPPSALQLTIYNIQMMGGSILSLSNPIYSMELHASTRPRRENDIDLATLGDSADQGLISPTDKNTLVAMEAINAAGGLFAEKTSGEAGITNPSSGN